LRSFGPDLITLRANALTYRTLLSLAPFLAVAFSLFNAFGGLGAAEAALRVRLLQNLAPGAAAAVAEQLDVFLQRIATGAVSGIGVLALVFTVLMLLSSMEQSFNALWKVDRGRPLLQRFVNYWAMVTVGPVLFALSFTLTSAARSSSLMAALTDRLPDGSSALMAALQLVPWLITCTAMTLLYLIVPNKAVRWRAAMGGGAVAGSLWELGKLAFTWASAHLFSYDAVYGAFASLVVLLLWLQTGWLIVLLGCKVAYALQHERALLAQRASEPPTPAQREMLAVRCMLEVGSAFLEGRPGPTAEELGAGTHLLEIRGEVLNPLVAAGMLIAVPAEARRRGQRNRDAVDERYRPGRDPARTTLAEVIDVFRGASQGPPRGDEGDIDEFVAALAARYAEAAHGLPEGLTVAEALDRIRSGDLPTSGAGPTSSP
jgi:membrane protein